MAVFFCDFMDKKNKLHIKNDRSLEERSKKIILSKEYMEIKDFTKGQTAYVLNMYRGRNRDPEIAETVVEAVGRKYVTAKYGIRYCKHEKSPFGLVEDTNRTGTGNRLLCLTREDAEKHVEWMELTRWLDTGAGSGGQYTLEQLRQVKKILQ